MSAGLPDETRRVVVARAHDAGTEVVLAQRGTVTELIVDGVFAMDTVDTATEHALARLALDEWRSAMHGTDGSDGARVLVGGLGLGFTVRALLDDARVAHVHVVELHPSVVAWARAGLLPQPSSLLADPRLTLSVGDVLEVLPRLPEGCVDAVLLDVDNGPGFLIHPANEAVYGADFLATVLRLLAAGGVLAVWSADRAPALADAMVAAGATCREVTLPVRRDGRELEYALYVARPRTGRRTGPRTEPRTLP